MPFRWDPPYIAEEPELDLRDVQFYKMANHIILHNHDYYILHQHYLATTSYLDEQRTFWNFVAGCTDLLGYKLAAYVRELPEYWKLNSPTRQLADEVDTLRHDLFGHIDYVMRHNKWLRRKKTSVTSSCC